MPTVSVRKGYLDGGRIVEVKAGFSTACGVGGVFLISHGGIYKVRFAVSVEIVHSHGVGNIRPEVGVLGVSKGALSGCGLERDVFGV